MRWAPPPQRCPGCSRANQRLFTTDLGHYSDRFIMQPLSNVSGLCNYRGAFNVVKLHGSFNWRTPDGRNAIVIGTEKTSQIAAFPLLATYWQIFRAVLQAGDVRLMIVGYGFGDEHVNAVIADAVENHGLRLFIWDTAPSLMDRVRAAPLGSQIWKGVLSTASRPMIEVFPSNQAETAEYRRILATVFG
jgi:SIR2-like domain